VDMSVKKKLEELTKQYPGGYCLVRLLRRYVGGYCLVMSLCGIGWVCIYRRVGPDVMRASLSVWVSWAG
jgi:hypothetical protein